MHRLKWLLVCAGALSLAMLAARQVGLRAPDSAALAWLKSLYSAECALPDCWHAIQIGKTTVREAATILQADPDLKVDMLPSRSYKTWVMRTYRQAPPQGVEVGVSGSPDEPIAPNGLWIYLPVDTLRMGEVIAVLGAPEWAWSCGSNGLTYYRIGAMRFMAQSRPDGRLSPHAPMLQIDLSRYPRRYEPVWEGFGYRPQHAEFMQRFCN